MTMQSDNRGDSHHEPTDAQEEMPLIWQQRRGCLADDAVSCERTSLHTKFPANREINREFCRIWPSTAISASNQRANSKACSQIPYATEQGNFAAITGNFFGITGKFNPG